MTNGLVFDGTYTTHVTGIPYTLNTSSNDGSWAEDENVNWTSGGVILGKDGSYTWFAGDASMTKSFYIPANVSIVVNSTGTHRGSGGSLSGNQAKFSITVSGISIFSSKSTSSSDSNFSCSNVTATLTSGNPNIMLKNEYGTSQANSTVKSLQITYKL